MSVVSAYQLTQDMRTTSSPPHSFAFLQGLGIAIVSEIPEFIAQAGHEQQTSRQALFPTTSTMPDVSVSVSASVHPRHTYGDTGTAYHCHHHHAIKMPGPSCGLCMPVLASSFAAWPQACPEGKHYLAIASRDLQSARWLDIEIFEPYLATS